MSLTNPIEPHRIGEFHVGYSRVGVIEPVFDDLIAQGVTVKVIRQKRIVGVPSLTTGQPEITWEPIEIDGLFVSRGDGQQEFDAGAVGMVDVYLRTADPLFHFDRVVYEGVVYEVVAPPLEVHGLNGGFLFRRASLKRLELQET
jgi:hypothetical protein